MFDPLFQFPSLPLEFADAVLELSQHLALTLESFP